MVQIPQYIKFIQLAFLGLTLAGPISSMASPHPKLLRRQAIFQTPTATVPATGSPFATPAAAASSLSTPTIVNNDLDNQILQFLLSLEYLDFYLFQAAVDQYQDSAYTTAGET